MAFQQPQQRPQPLRQVSPAKPVVTDTTVPASPARKRTIDESQEWILFSPAQNDSSTAQTARTATHLSDFGSLETHIRSQPIGNSQDNDLTCQGTELDDDGAELDSLDDGLHAFHHPFSPSSNHLDQSGGTVLPTHDGFGTFPSSAGLQEQLWQFERYNPHRKRHVRRRSSVQKKLDAMEEEEEMDVEDERTARIEKWRLEQSKAVLEEIEKETRRRRRRMSRISGGTGSIDMRSNLHENAAAAVMMRQGQVIHEEPETVKSEEVRPSESFWQRITRRVIRDLIGLDENTLSVIFGESLPEEASPTPTQPSPIAVATASPPLSRVTFDDPGYSWEVKLLNHIARELGVLVHQLTEHDGRAFNTYLRTHEEPDYAGLPIRETPRRQPSLRQRRRQQPITTSTDPTFTPTLSQPPLTPIDAPDTSLWGIEEDPLEDSAELQQEREYWERDIDVNMIFSYLKRRFSHSQPAPQPPYTSTTFEPSLPLPSSWATVPTASALGTSPESLRRAEVIRRQHPLVSRAAAQAQSRRRDSLLKRHQVQQILQKRAGSSSCASQSTKRSRRSGSSRHYWDIGGSVGSVGSGPAMSSGALGGWGEV